MKLLIDEMYSPAITAGLRARGHDVVSVGERDDLSGAADVRVMEVAMSEGRVIYTNNVRDFVPLALAAMREDAVFPGLILTSDKSLPRSKKTIERHVELLDRLLTNHAGDVSLDARVIWLS